MSRPRRSLLYYVSAPSAQLFWCPQRHRWLKDISDSPQVSIYRRCRTIRAAARAAMGLSRRGVSALVIREGITAARRRWVIPGLPTPTYRCPHCDTELDAPETVPVVGDGGKCETCKGLFAFNGAKLVPIDVVDLSEEQVTEKMQCPTCRHRLDRTRGSREIRVNDQTMCVYCGDIAVIIEGGLLRAQTPEEAEESSRDPRVMAIRKALAEVRREATEPM